MHDKPWQSVVAKHGPFSLLPLARGRFSRLPPPGPRCLLHRVTGSPRLTTMETGSLRQGLDADDFSSGGTGARLARAVIIVAGVCALIASLVTFV